MARHRTYSLEFKKQVVQEYLTGGASLHGLAKRYRMSRNLIRLWTAKYEAGEFTDDVAVADTIDEYEARIAALERKVGQLTMENDFLKKTLPHSTSTGATSSSIVSGPTVSADQTDADS